MYNIYETYKLKTLRKPYIQPQTRSVLYRSNNILSPLCNEIVLTLPQIASFRRPTWAHLCPVGPRWAHVGPMNLAIRVFIPQSSNQPDLWWILWLQSKSTVIRTEHWSGKLYTFRPINCLECTPQSEMNKGYYGTENPFPPSIYCNHAVWLTA